VGTLVIIAVGNGTGAGWMLAGLVISLVILILQILVGLGKYTAHWPLWATTTRPGQLAAMGLYSAFALFCAAGFLAAL
jgi:hypothetical protein